MEKRTYLQEISQPSFLKDSWYTLNKRNKKSYGLSRESLQEFQSNLDKNISEISNQLINNKYKLGKVRGALLKRKVPIISQGKKDFRPLRIADIRDRLVLKAVSIKIDKLLSKKYYLDNQCSFAYRKNLGIEDAIRKMVVEFNSGKKIILEADIEKFFDSVDRIKLLKEVFKDLEPDTSLNKLIEEGLSQEVGNLNEFTLFAHYFEGSENGIPQGNALSPLMANIYLSSFDKRMINEDLSLIRYADDFIVMCKDRKEAFKAYEIAKEEIENKLKLKLHPLSSDFNDSLFSNTKTKIIDPRFDIFKFLSIRFNGSELWVDKEKVKDLKESLRKITNTNNSRNVMQLLVKTKNLLEGWLSSFKFTNLERYTDEIDNYIDYLLINSLRKFGFVLRTKYSRTLKKGNKKFQLLTKKQRINSGVPMCMEFLDTIDRNIILLKT